MPIVVYFDINTGKVNSIQKSVCEELFINRLDAIEILPDDPLLSTPINNLIVENGHLRELNEEEKNKNIESQRILVSPSQSKNNERSMLIQKLKISLDNWVNLNSAKKDESLKNLITLILNDKI